MALTALYELPAPAKLNLFLHVIGRRADGYHLLQSLFVLIDWCDLLHVERRSDGRLQRHDLSAALPENDLCLRAARALQSASGSTLGADIHIDKRVPWGAGLGGGSSDAATTLLALNRLWALHWPRQRLLELGLSLGADVPFFINGCNAFVEGIGERFMPVGVAPSCFAVVKPAAALPTAQIFAHPALKRDTRPVIVAGSFANAKLLDDWKAGKFEFGRNDLQPCAQELCPEVMVVARWLQRHHGNSRMTGSGSAVFANLGSAVQLGVTWPPQPLAAGWVGRLCRSLPEHPLRGWAA